MRKKKSRVDVRTYSAVALPHLENILARNESVLETITEKLVRNVVSKGSLYIFGSGHSSILSLEIYHRAGGPSFVIPLLSDYFLPTAGPRVVRMMERMEGSASVLLDRIQPRRGEMIWLVSQSGINSAVIDLAIHARKAKLTTVAFTSLTHSQEVQSRHPSRKRLFEICDHVVDLGGVMGDAAIPVSGSVSTGPLSTLSGVFLAHSILTTAVARLEERGVHCTYTSVNSPEGERRNRKLEKFAALRDPLLR